MEPVTFKEWLKQQNKPRVDAIFEVLRDTGEPVFEGMSGRGQIMANNEALFEVLIHQNMSDAEFIYDLSDEERAEYQGLKDEVHDELVKLCDRLFDWFPKRPPAPAPPVDVSKPRGDDGDNELPRGTCSCKKLPGANHKCTHPEKECTQRGQHANGEFKGIDAIRQCFEVSP